MVKEYPAATCFAQSSGTSINLGQEMLPFMETDKLWDFVNEHNISRKDNSPVEAYLYNWIEKAQGPMVFMSDWSLRTTWRTLRMITGSSSRSIRP